RRRRVTRALPPIGAVDRRRRPSMWTGGPSAAVRAIPLDHRPALRRRPVLGGTRRPHTLARTCSGRAFRALRREDLAIEHDPIELLESKLPVRSLRHRVVPLSVRPELAIPTRARERFGRRNEPRADALTAHVGINVPPFDIRDRTRFTPIRVGALANFDEPAE